MSRDNDGVNGENSQQNATNSKSDFRIRAHERDSFPYELNFTNRHTGTIE
jgi:hypothetical protein